MWTFHGGGCPGPTDGEEAYDFYDNLVETWGPETSFGLAASGRRRRASVRETPQASIESPPPGSALLDETTDEQGRLVLRSLEESGTTIETVSSGSGEPVSEDIVGVIADPNPENGSG